MSLPDATRRLFAHYGLESKEPAAWAFVIERLLEEGDSEDLRWLTANLPEERLSSWLASRGARRLSRRSRRFWETVLGVEPEPIRGDRGELWPL